MRDVEELGVPTDHGEQVRLESLEMWSPFMLGKEEVSEFKRLADVEGALLFEVNFDVTADGKVIIFCVDYDPPLESLPPSVQAHLLEALSRRLLGFTAADGTAQHLLPTRVERPVLFLRRMLQLQFEMEQSKYQDAEN